MSITTSSPLQGLVLDFMELNMDPKMPFSDLLDDEIKALRRRVDKAFNDYEAVAITRRKYPGSYWDGRV